ncbi:MAG: AAA family ATPase [Candidatus Lokiarchaeota archaeon]|nr:AAA family ATPase [Candidatus Lokiarchaeota archaeon]
MIITISGLHGTGKSTVGKLVAKALSLNYYSTGQAFRDLAKEMGMNLQEFSRYVEEHHDIDKKLDEKIIKIAEKNNILIDSQLSGHILRNVADFKIHLICSLETRVRRIADRDQSSYELKMKETLIRESSELERFKKLYHINLDNLEDIRLFHDLVIDTEGLSIDEIVELIISKLRN